MCHKTTRDSHVMLRVKVLEFNFPCLTFKSLLGVFTVTNGLKVEQNFARMFFRNAI